MPSPLRALLYLLTATLISAALCLCIRGAVMLYETYQTLQWIEELTR